MIVKTVDSWSIFEVTSVMTRIPSDGSCLADVTKAGFWTTSESLSDVGHTLSGRLFADNACNLEVPEEKNEAVIIHFLYMNSMGYNSQIFKSEFTFGIWCKYRRCSFGGDLTFPRKIMWWALVITINFLPILSSICFHCNR